MKRFQLFEFEDFKWFPKIIRDGGTDYLRFMIENFNIYKPAFSIVKKLLKITNNKIIIDLCSGGGGACIKMEEAINNLSTGEYQITLTDKFPNIPAFNYIKSVSKGNIDFIERSIDAASVPTDLKGLRTFFSAFHHFSPEKAMQILKNASANKQPIAIFEGGERSIIDILGIIISTPVLFFIFTPFIRPLKFSRFIFTYLLPLIPLFTTWDGVVSMLRMYKPEELLALARSAENENYIWESKRIPNGLSKVIYLTGYAEK